MPVASVPGSVMTVVSSLVCNTVLLPTVSLVDGTGSRSMMTLEAAVELEINKSFLGLRDFTCRC